jgi:hypothetical protein
MTFLHNRVGLGATIIAAAMMLVPVSAQAACDGGDCPITGGTLRTMVGGGFIIPQVPSVQPFTGPQGSPDRTTTTSMGATNFIPGCPGCGQMGFGNTARGAIRPITGAQVTINKEGGTAAPFSIDVPLGQLTYGSHPTSVPPKAGYYTTPILVQVPLNFFVPPLLGVSTRNGQSFPGETRISPSSLTANNPAATVLGGPMHLEAGGRGGAPTLTYCAGAIVPAAPIPGTWTGGCTGFGTPTTGGTLMSPGVQVAAVEVRYTKTANQFGGVGTQRQVKRTGGTNDWIGRINFNNFIVPIDRDAMALTSVKKNYPTLPQNLVEPVVWGATFGAVVQRIGGSSPGNMVSAFLTLNGAPQNTATVMITQNPPSLGGPGTDMGLGQTSTSWGGPLTTGMVTVQQLAGGTLQPSTWSNTGNDQRTPGGQGMVSLVSGSLSSRNISGPGTSRTLLTLQLPEPSMALGLFVGVAALVGVSRRRNR